MDNIYSMSEEKDNSNITHYGERLAIVMCLVFHSTSCKVPTYCQGTSSSTSWEFLRRLYPSNISQSDLVLMTTIKFIYKQASKCSSDS